MAKIGETDARWIVSPRSDGKNVDNWHWTEKDLFEWCKTEFEMRFKKVKVPSQVALLKIIKCDSVKGSMLVCNRKGKTLYVYDVQLKLDWAGQIKKAVSDKEDNENKEDNDDKKDKKDKKNKITAKGTIYVDDISNDDEKYRISIKTDSESSENQVIIDEMKKKAIQVVESIIDSVIQDMKGIKPVKEQIVGTSVKGQTVGNSVKEQTVSNSVKEQTVGNSAKEQTVSTTPQFCNAVCHIRFQVSPTELYNALIEEEHGQFGLTFFELFEGQVDGEQVELVTDSKIVHKWRLASWPANHFSRVDMSISNLENTGTQLALTHTEIPYSQYDNTRIQWEIFWKKIKSLYGFDYTITSWF